MSPAYRDKDRNGNVTAFPIRMMDRDPEDGWIVIYEPRLLDYEKAADLLIQIVTADYPDERSEAIEEAKSVIARLRRNVYR